MNGYKTYNTHQTITQDCYDIVLAVLPWAPVDSPSIQLGVLKAVLDREGISTKTAHLNVEFYKFLEHHPISAAIANVSQHHNALKDISPVSPWMFAVPPVFTNKPAIDDFFAVNRKTMTDKDLTCFELVLGLREIVPAFFEHCAAELLALRPKVVGFSCSFDQRVPSLVLGHMLKLALPDLKIVFGGTNMDGLMGETFIKTFPWVDAVVRGDGENVLPRLCHFLCSNDGAPPPPLPGLCIRHEDRILISPESLETKAVLKDGPVPDYDDYYERIRDTKLSEHEATRIPVEISRGCWWFKQKCKFCGRSEDNLYYRAKPLRNTANEMRILSEKYRQLAFMMVDPAVRPSYMAKLMCGLREEGLDFTAWCQSRLDFTREDFQALRRGGVSTIFVGIESLSTPVLKLMRKGHTALDAIQILKWGVEYGITITWNLIHGFPGEKPEHYEQMADLMRSLNHLPPPFQLDPLALCRSSVYFDAPQEYGIRLLDPDPMLDPLYHLAHELGKGEHSRSLAAKLEASYPMIPPETVEMCRELVNRWKQEYSINYGKLWYRRGKGFLDIFDYRSGHSNEVFSLDETEGKIFLACNTPKTAQAVWSELEPDEQEAFCLDEVIEFLDLLVEKRLSYREDGFYISLAVSRSGHA